MLIKRRWFWHGFQNGQTGRGKKDKRIRAHADTPRITVGFNRSVWDVFSFAVFFKITHVIDL